MSRGLPHGRTRPAPPVSAEQDQPRLTHRHGGRRRNGTPADRHRRRTRGRRGHLEQGRRLRVHRQLEHQHRQRLLRRTASQSSSTGRRKSGRSTPRARIRPPRTSRSPSPRRCSRARDPAPCRLCSVRRSHPGRGHPRHHPGRRADRHQVRYLAQTTKRSVRDVQPQTTPQSRAGTAEMYTVVHGDTLSGIAGSAMSRAVGSGCTTRTAAPSAPTRT